MSKRHHANRRKTYGRRQHELRERGQREPQPESYDLALDDPSPGDMADRFTLLDPRPARLRFVLGD